MAELESTTIYELVGGHETFARLCESFYSRVEKEPVLRPMYPESLEAPREHLALFLSQFFGGPDTYSQLRGHPRLRARHLPFKIGRRERDVWVKHMLAALDESGIEEPAYSELKQYFENAATFMINQLE